MARPPLDRQRRRRALLVALSLAAAALAGKVLYDSSDEVFTAADLLTHLDWGWVAVGLLAEVVSYLVRGGAQAVVLRQGRVSVAEGAPGHRTPGLVVLAGGTLAGDAAAYCLPFGFAASGVVMFDVLRRRGVDAAVAGWMFGVSTLLYVGAVAVLTVAAVQVAGDADPVPGLWAVSVGLIALLGGMTLIYVLTKSHRASAGRRPARAGRTARWLPLDRLRAVLSRLRRIRLRPWLAAAAFALMLVSWVSDIAVLGVAYPAVGTSPPWAGLLLAYCAGQIAAALPVTPGGIGVVEGSLTLALVAFGGARTVTLAAVLLYRIITYWACIPLGGLAWLALRFERGGGR
jgi:uncharacterized membrane protein YbhN (UPF0104 family)